MDNSIDDPAEESSQEENQISAGMELPVKIDTLSVDGTQPEIGDDVEVKVTGTVKRIRDDCAYVAIDKANNEPIENPPAQPEDMTHDNMLAMAQQADQQGSYM